MLNPTNSHFISSHNHWAPQRLARPGRSQPEHAGCPCCLKIEGSKAWLGAPWPWIWGSSQRRDTRWRQTGDVASPPIQLLGWAVPSGYTKEGGYEKPPPRMHLFYIYNSALHAFHLHFFLLCVCSHHRIQCACGGQRRVCGNQFPPSNMRALGIRLRLPGLTASAHTAESLRRPLALFLSMESIFSHTVCSAEWLVCSCSYCVLQCKV